MLFRKEIEIDREESRDSLPLHWSSKTDHNLSTSSPHIHMHMPLISRGEYYRIYNLNVLILFYYWSIFTFLTSSVEMLVIISEQHSFPYPSAIISLANSVLVQCARLPWISAYPVQCTAAVKLMVRKNFAIVNTS